MLPLFKLEKAEAERKAAVQKSGGVGENGNRPYTDANRRYAVYVFCAYKRARLRGINPPVTVFTKAY